MYQSSRSDYESMSQATYSASSQTASYSVVIGDGRPRGCCGKGCCWWGRKKLGLE